MCNNTCPPAHRPRRRDIWNGFVAQFFVFSDLIYCRSFPPSKGTV